MTVDEQDATLRAEVDALKREVARLTEEKADLEVLLDTVTHHSDFIEKEFERTVQVLQEEQRRLTEEKSLTTMLRKALAQQVPAASDPPQ
jgi:predicted  nucleic acid-binding Zn-ribbon protein